jgi:two-component system sensor histidine kinase CiaH
MFKRTHIRLTLLNSLVFIILISALGFVIYSYMEKRLYKDVNESLIRTIEHLGEGHLELGPRGFRMPTDLRAGMIIWDENNKAIEFSPNLSVFIQDKSIAAPKEFNKIHDIEVDNYSFRTIAVQVEIQNEKLTFQILRNIDSERELLNKLLLIMIIGCGIGILCAVAAGYFLAGRALIPIQNAWQKQQQFVSDASHELRTPLAVIQSKTDLLFRSPAATIQDKAIDISVIANECRRLSKLVANLLTLARSDSDQIEMEKKEFRLDSLLYEVAEHYRDIAEFQEKTLDVQVPDSVTFMGDKERIHQLLVILLDNAMKYTEPGGEIKLICQQSPSLITIRVQDSGIGIAEEDIPKIFDRFYQSDKARTMSEGAGLGLSIASWIIDKHQGKVKVYSQLGKGTTFEITFPKNQKL